MYQNHNSFLFFLLLRKTITLKIIIIIMQLRLLSILLLCLGYNAVSQVGIGTVNVDPSAILEIKSNNKGFFNAPNDNCRAQCHSECRGRVNGI